MNIIPLLSTTHLKETAFWTPDRHVGIIHITKHDKLIILLLLSMLMRIGGRERVGLVCLVVMSN